ncbi:hypothetical protein NL676_017461 [Syzygium grande]|nr:hypothetical protein NL676_017461 [Syzygium grande]
MEPSNLAPARFRSSHDQLRPWPGPARSRSRPDGHDRAVGRATTAGSNVDKKNGGAGSASRAPKTYTRFCCRHGWPEEAPADITSTKRGMTARGIYQSAGTR